MFFTTPSSNSCMKSTTIIGNRLKPNGDSRSMNTFFCTHIKSLQLGIVNLYLPVSAQARTPSAAAQPQHLLRGCRDCKLPPWQRRFYFEDMSVAVTTWPSHRSQDQGFQTSTLGPRILDMGRRLCLGWLQEGSYLKFNGM